MKYLIFAIGVFSSLAHADVTVDENGKGFVGKGDVQSIFGWNNAGLQENAPRVVFRLSTTGTATWVCAGYNGANKYTTMKKSSEANKVTGNVAYTARKNSQAQVTGFILSGRDVNTTLGSTIGDCPPAKGWVVPPSLVEGSIEHGATDLLLEVSIGDDVWHELPITPVI